MRTSPFIWLGSGRAKKQHVGAKGRWLDEATKARLPVPQGGILLDDLYQIMVQEGVVIVDPHVVSVPDPIWLSEVLYRDVRFPRLQKKVAVRHTFATAPEDQDDPESMPESWHGRCPAQLNIDPQNPQQLAQALGAAWSIVAHEGLTLRRDLLLMEMVAEEVGGTAVTLADRDHDLLWREGTDETLSAGHEIPRLRPFQRGDQQLPPHAIRLQRLLDGVRRTFGPESWQIDWVDDGKICWLLQLTQPELKQISSLGIRGM